MSSPRPSPPTPVKGPTSIHAQFEAAFNACDAAALASLYEADAVLVVAPGESVQGQSAIQAAFEPYFSAHPTIRIATTSCVEGAGGLALLECDWTISGTGPEGPFEKSGRSVEAVRRQTDGRWLYILDNPQAGAK